MQTPDPPYKGSNQKWETSDISATHRDQQGTKERVPDYPSGKSMAKRGSHDSASFFALDQQQFKALLDQVARQGRNQGPPRTDDQRGIRAPELDTVDFSKWRTWREKFIATVEINS